MAFDYPSPENRYLLTHSHLLCDCFNRLTGRHLIQSFPSDEARAKALFHAQFAVLSHDVADDPILTYANLTALKLFELSWDELIVMPSRYTAKPVDRLARQALLEAVNLQGFSSDYSGIRISKTGREFQINNATVWNLIDNEGNYQGQAATFSEWRFL